MALLDWGPTYVNRPGSRDLHRRRRRHHYQLLTPHLPAKPKARLHTLPSQPASGRSLTREPLGADHLRPGALHTAAAAVTALSGRQVLGWDRDAWSRSISDDSSWYACLAD